ncbi:hypothetical protein BT93_L1233 [Corymbia citriodora subsp. variegata]|uniref:AAA+ ATPase domain-containing protein n=1 Tax=Corymbia citriodora subsp. variegata TaxID=360336 RepID=A0A8T0CT49_CORYI|nr:hypothetical protein BT93_L1233 [Corymbia citriodora subsp. variegata]
MSADSVVAVAWDVLKCCVVVSIKHVFVYVFSSKSFENSLRGEVRKLQIGAQRVKILKEEARNNVRNFLDVFTEWEESADKVLAEAQELLDNFEKATKTCCYGTLPDPKFRYQFSREAEVRIKSIKQLAQDGSRFNGLDDISFIDPAPGNVTAPDPGRREGKDVVPSTAASASVFSTSMSIKLRDAGVFESRALMIRNIMDALANNSNSVVGVYGMGGVGKSTLLDDVKKILSEEKSFDLIAKANVSENPDIKTIQGEIADALGITNIKNKECVSGRAELLHRRLKKESENKKVLIILDNLWKGLDLKSVGIPCGHDNKVIGCKLLMTSRYRHVLQKDMLSDKEFSLDGLRKEEATRLFESTVGDKVHDDEYKHLVDVALGKCGGMPFLVVAMAKRLRKAELSVWEDTLDKIEQYRDKENKDLIDGMLRYSYDELEGEVKSLLQLCVVYGISKPSLENLMRYGFGLGLFQGVNSIEKARKRLSSHICTLQDFSLLLDSENVDGLKIHDLVRDFVATTSLRDHPLLVLKNEVKSVIELPKDKPSNYMAICFPYVDMEELPQNLNCPELRIFLLFTNNESLHVPDSLFNSMRKLMVLNLSGVNLTRSPLPFQLLENLCTLCLDGCLLEDVAILGKLKGLEILSFVNSKIQRLPKEIGQLVKLRLLDLNNCSKLQIIEPGVLGNLINLEELCMENSFNQWNAGELPTPPTNANLVELNNMKKLCTLYVFIPNWRMLPRDLNVEKLTKYKIQIGFARRWRKIKGSKTLELKLNVISDILQKECIQSILGGADDLFLEGLNGIEQSICALSKKGFSKLKHLHINNSPFVHYIHQLPSCTDFQRLESLILSNLIHLEKLCRGNIYSKSFRALKVIQVRRCHKMEVLFPLSSIRELPWLEEIEVSDCKSMQGIVEADHCGNVELRNLHVLKLYNLPNMKNFFNTGSTPSSNASDDQVGTQNAFFSGQQVTFSRLETLKIDGLDKVEFLFFPSTIKSLAQLRDLDICNCKKMEAIIVDEEALGLETSETLEFPMLAALNLQHLESFLCFSRGKRLREARSQDHIKSCSTSREVSVPSLKSLTMIGLPNMKEIWSNDFSLELSNLQTLEVAQCKSLSKVISSRPPIKLLHNLCIRDCNSVQEIFDLNEPSTNGNVDTLFEVTTLKLVKLGSLRCIWNKNPCGIMGFHNLNKLEVDHCDDLGFLFFPSMIKSLIQLRDLTVRRCKKMEAIITEEEGLGLGASETLAFPMLTNLTLTYLESLKCFSREKCSQEARSQDCVKSPSAALFNQEVAFQRLEKLKIIGLDNLEFLFSPSMVKSLTQLKKLTVSSCEKMEAIIMEEEALGMETSEILAFPMLTKLRLERLKSLTCFSHGKCAQESRSQNRVGSCATTLFNQKVAYPSLENLYIEGMENVGMMWDDQIAVDSFSKLKLLSVNECKNLVNVVPPFILGRLKSLETLEVEACKSLEVVFKLQPSNPLDGHRVARSSLKKMRLYDLPKLKRVWDKEIHCQVKFQCLRWVSLQGCPRLTSMFLASIAKDLIQLEELKINQCGIVELIGKEGPTNEPSIDVEAIEGPSQVASSFPSYFQRMKTIDVSHCHGLSNMFTPTIANNLVEITKLRISNCNILTEVISDEGGNEGHVVAFNQLKYMELDGLAQLRCFSSGGYTLMLPLLEDIIANRCPKMMFFSKGPVKVPKLKRVQVGLKVGYEAIEYPYFWKGNLNMTIQNMFEEMATLAGTKFMQLSEFPELIGKWHSELNPIMSSWQLESLVVDKCPFINAISSNLMLVLERMTRLQVCDCEPLEEIFDLKGLEAVNCTGVLPKLQDLCLVNLPKLRQLWNRDLQGMMCFNSLRHLGLYKCSNLRHAFVPSMAQCLPNLRDVEIKECEQMEGVIVDEEGQGSVVEKITFPNLEWINLECLLNLTSFLSWKNHTLECPMLLELSIAHCPKMRSLTWHYSMDTDNGTPSLFTPQLASSLCACMRGFWAVTRIGARWLWWLEVDLRCGSDFGVDSVLALISAKKSNKVRRKEERKKSG